VIFLAHAVDVHLRAPLPVPDNAPAIGYLRSYVVVAQDPDRAIELIEEQVHADGGSIRALRSIVQVELSSLPEDAQRRLDDTETAGVRWMTGRAYFSRR
jgi:hypothetical protein